MMRALAALFIATIGLIVLVAIARAAEQPDTAREFTCLSWWTLPDGEEICVEQPWQRTARSRPPSIIAPEPDLCIFASDVRNGLYRWRACEAVK